MKLVFKKSNFNDTEAGQVIMSLRMILKTEALLKYMVSGFMN